MAVAAYLVVALAALCGIWARMTKRPFHADTLITDFWQSSADEVKYALAFELPDIHAHNQIIIETKVKAARLAIIAAAVEVAAVGAMVIWTV